MSSDNASDVSAKSPDRGRGRGNYRGRGGSAERQQYVPFHPRPANASVSGPQFSIISSNQANKGRRSANGYSRPVPRGPLLKSKQDWKGWQDLAVDVFDLPPETTTWDLYDAFQKQGKVQYIYMDQNTSGGKNGQARVRFSPVPDRDFWSTGRYPVSIGIPPGVTAAFPVNLVKTNRKWLIQSPVRKHIWYPEVMKLIPSTIDWGFMLDTKTMMHMRSTQSEIDSDTKTPVAPGFQVDLLRKKIVVYFPYRFSNPLIPLVRSKDRVNHFMLWLPFEQIDKIYRTDEDNMSTSIVVSLSSPPRYYRKKQNGKASHSADSNTWSEMDTWYRQTDIVYDPDPLMRTPVSLKKEEDLEIDIGRWTSYRVVFAKNATNNPDIFSKIHEALKDFNIPIEPIDGFSTVPAAEPNFWSLVDYKPPANQSALSLLDQSQDDFHLPFEIRYQLEVCISQGVMLVHNLTAEVLNALVKLARENTAQAQSILEYCAEADSRVHDPMSIFTNKDALGRYIRTKIPEYCAYARKATVTPSGIYFSTPSVETSNRVIRHFSRWGDRFLRVQFTDEKFEGRINSSVDKVRDDQVYTRVFRTLVNGIIIGDRKYEFLAFGNSQFRQSGAYFFCPNEEITCEDIRSWMGKFAHIKVVAKYAARLGQCFSTTRAIHGSRVEVGKIHDIQRNGSNFTDGVGKISQLEAQIIAAALGLPIAAHVPSCFQFRLGGCKGILVVWPDVRGRQIKIRPSQQKFEAVYNGLEVIRCSRFSNASLNRQTISILSSLGVKDEVFIDLLIKRLSQYSAAMTDSAEALKLLQKLIDENNMTISIATMIVNGFMDKNEPFVMALLHLWKAWSVKLLKEKTKIMIEDGAFLFGCVDETATLKGHRNDARPQHEDDIPEIFLQVPEYGNMEKYRVIVGLCVVGRNPSLHPGDIRVVRAVDIPQLRHLRNVVVFPQLGDRDIPGMCSGGDLDGDDFFVIWDKNLIPPRWNLDPMNFTPPPPREKPNGAPVEINDIKKFFVRYMKNDTLPTIAHAHLAQSDRLDGGVQHPICLELAELHSKAVDFVKSGQSAVMKKSLAPTKFPHFMESKYRRKEKIYRSGKILGQLYDKVETEDFVPQYNPPFDQRILRAYQPDSDMLKTARQLKVQYDTAMKRIMAQMEIGTEFEVYTAFILTRPRIGSDYKWQEEIGIHSDNLKDRFRSACIEAAGSRDFTILAPFVAAMYRVTWEEMQIALAECSATKMVGGKEVPKRKMLPKFMPLISFPWIFHEVLGRIAMGADAKADLEGLGMTVLKPSGQRRERVVGEAVDDEDDFVQTEEGITHRGELLDLFRPDSDDDEGAEACTQSVGKDGKPSLNTVARNLQVETRQLDCANIAPPDDNDDDEFDGIPLDGFLNPSRDTHDLQKSTAQDSSDEFTSNTGDIIMPDHSGSRSINPCLSEDRRPLHINNGLTPLERAGSIPPAVSPRTNSHRPFRAAEAGESDNPPITESSTAAAAAAAPQVDPASEAEQEGLISSSGDEEEVISFDEEDDVAMDRLKQLLVGHEQRNGI